MNPHPHRWEVLPGVELEAGRSTHTQLRCLGCGVKFHAAQITQAAVALALREPCSSSISPPPSATPLEAAAAQVVVETVLRASRTPSAEALAALAAALPPNYMPGAYHRILAPEIEALYQMVEGLRRRPTEEEIVAHAHAFGGDWLIVENTRTDRRAARVRSVFARAGVDAPPHAR